MKLIKKKKRAKIVNAKDMKIPIVQNILQNLGAFRAIFEIILFNFFVLNIAIKGKNTKTASFLFLKILTKNATINQKIIEITNQGFVIKVKKISKKLI